MLKPNIEKHIEAINASFKLITLMVSILSLLTFLIIFVILWEEPKEIIQKKSPTSLPDTNFTHLWQAPEDWRMMKLSASDKKWLNMGVN